MITFNVVNVYDVEKNYIYFVDILRIERDFATHEHKYSINVSS